MGWRGMAKPRGGKGSSGRPNSPLFHPLACRASILVPWVKEKSLLPCAVLTDQEGAVKVNQGRAKNPCKYIHCRSISVCIGLWWNKVAGSLLLRINLMVKGSAWHDFKPDSFLFSWLVLGDQIGCLPVSLHELRNGMGHGMLWNLSTNDVFLGFRCMAIFVFMYVDAWFDVGTVLTQERKKVWPKLACFGESRELKVCWQWMQSWGAS